jgi:hypothetical protein
MSTPTNSLEQQLLDQFLDQLLWSEGRFITWPLEFKKPPYELLGLLDEVYKCGENIKKDEALLTANKLAELREWFFGGAAYVYEFERQIREVANG